MLALGTVAFEGVVCLYLAKLAKALLRGTCTLCRVSGSGLFGSNLGEQVALDRARSLKQHLQLLGQVRKILALGRIKLPQQYPKLLLQDLEPAGLGCPPP